MFYFLYKESFTSLMLRRLLKNIFITPDINISRGSFYTSGMVAEIISSLSHIFKYMYILHPCLRMFIFAIYSTVSYFNLVTICGILVAFLPFSLNT